MTANIMVSPPYQPFTLPNKFSAVFNGEVWCGLVDKDPLVPANQVQIYVVNEDGSRTPVTQPVKLNHAGFLTYNGNPAKFVTESNHSLLVRNMLKAQVWYEPNMAKIDPDTLLAMLQAVDGLGVIGGLVGKLTLKVPSDHATMSDAVNYVKNNIRMTSNSEIVVLIESGHVLSAPLNLSGGDYSNFTISSEDPEVRVRNGALVQFSDRTVWKPVFGADNGCNFPVIDVLINLTDYKGSDGVTRDGSGVVSLRGSKVLVNKGKGCIAGYQGAIAYDSASIYCADAIFTNAIEAGLTAWSESMIYADRVNVSSSEKYGLRSTEGSSLSAKFATAKNCGRHAARAVSSSFLDVSDSDLSFSATNAVYARHACIVNANNSNLSNSGSLPLPVGEINAGVYSLRGSIVSAIQCKCDDSVAGLIADGGSVIAAATTTLKNCTDAVIARKGSTIDASFCDASGSKNVALIDGASTGVLTGIKCQSPTKGILVNNASKVDCRDSSVTNCAGNALFVTGGSSVCAESAKFSGCASNAVYSIASWISARSSVCSDSNRGFVAENGGFIDASSASASNCAQEGVYAISGGSINFTNGMAPNCDRGVRCDAGVVSAKGATLTGARTAGVVGTFGSDINISSANCRKGSSDSTSDIQCFGGSIVKAYNTTGGTNDPKNTPAANGLILGN